MEARTLEVLPGVRCVFTNSSTQLTQADRILVGELVKRKNHFLHLLTECNSKKLKYAEWRAVFFSKIFIERGPTMFISC